MRGSRLFLVGMVGLLLAGCLRSTPELASDINLTPRDKALLARAPYGSAVIPEAYRRHIVDFRRR